MSTSIALHSRHTTIRLVAIALMSVVVSAGSARSRARADVVTGCVLTPNTTTPAACHLVASEPMEIEAAGTLQWLVTVHRGDTTVVYGQGDAGRCFLEGAAGTDRQIALCAGAIRPGDVVDATAQGTGSVIIGNLVCAHDPLCRPPYQ